MTVSVHELVVTGPGKRPATLKLEGQSHLVFRPRRTPASRTSLSASATALVVATNPKDVGYSEGYTRTALQVSIADGRLFILFRDLTDGAELVYEGFHTQPPQDGTAALEPASATCYPSGAVVQA